MSNFTGLAKIQKINNEEPDEFEKSISQALLDLEMNSDMKAHLRELHIKAAKEVDVGGKRAIVIFVPPPQLKSFQKVQTRLVRELEKKFAGKVSPSVRSRLYFSLQTLNMMKLGNDYSK